jgi:hypothetical protein
VIPIATSDLGAPAQQAPRVPTPFWPSPIWLSLLLSGLGLAIAPAVQAEPPALHYAWQVAGLTRSQCLTQAQRALAAQGMVALQSDGISIAGQTDSVTAMFLCLDHPQTTPANAISTVVMVVAGSDEAQTEALREALQQAF